MGNETASFFKKVMFEDPEHGRIIGVMFPDIKREDRMNPDSMLFNLQSRQMIKAKPGGEWMHDVLDALKDLKCPTRGHSYSQFVGANPKEDVPKMERTPTG